MYELQDKVVLITGAARGQGREHAVRCAAEGATIIAVDMCSDNTSSPFALATRADLDETADLVKKAGSRVYATQADVRDTTQIDGAVAAGVAEFGRLDALVANAATLNFGLAHQLTDEAWSEVVDTNLTGIFKTVRAAVPTLLEQGDGGSIVLISSTGGLKGIPGLAHYTAAKHGVVGFAKTLANELGAHRIRVNVVHPTIVPTAMVRNDSMYKLFRPDLDSPTVDDFIEAANALHILPVPWVEPSDVTEAVLWLLSERSRNITGISLPVDAGLLAK